MQGNEQVFEFRTPPHSREAEQSLLGALLLDNQAFEKISPLKAEAFYFDNHRRIFGALERMIEAGKEADVVTVSEAMDATADKDKYGGLAYLGELAQNTPSAFNIKSYARLVRDRWMQRRMLQCGTEIAENAFTPADVDEMLEDAESKVLAIRDSGAPQSEPVHIGKAAVEYVEWADSHPNGIETGLKDFDALTGGLQPGNLVIVAGRTHMGKTALALQFAEHICESAPGLVFSLEATRREIAGRMIEWHKRRLGRDGAIDRVFKLNLFIDESGVITPGMIRSRLRRVKRSHGCSLVVVDYLQLVRGRGDNREQEIASVSRELKVIAKEFEVPVIALAQLSRKVEERADKRPHMSDLRESGAIEQDADLIVLLYRPDYYDPNFSDTTAECEIHVPKNRNNGRNGLIKASFNRDMGRFGDWMPEFYRKGVA